MVKGTPKSLRLSSELPETYKERRYSSILNRNFINIVLLGDSKVGKSSFVIKYVEGKFEPYHVVTLGTEFYFKNIIFKECKYTLNFIVTSGAPEYKEDYTKSYQNVDFFLMFYDITQKETFENLKKLVDEIKDYIFLYKNQCSNIIFLGNKCESKNKVVNYDESEAYCNKNNIDFYEISVKNNNGINKVINKLVETFHDMAKN